MSIHRALGVASAMVALAIGGAAGARAQAFDPDDLAWDLVDEDCGSLPEGPVATTPPRATGPVATAPVAPPVAAATTAHPSPRRDAHPVRPARSEPAPSHDGALPRGRAVGGLTRDACEAVLRSEGVHFERADGDATSSAVAQPIRLTSPLRGIEIRPHGGDGSSIHSVIDCRLAVAFVGWADELRAAGFVAVEHVSIFRPGARVARTRRPSGHSHALALDLLRLVRSDGTFFSVLDDWTPRVRGTDPCGSYEESEASAQVRRLVCGAAAAEIFQVVITPHHDDAHANHVHLEIVPGVDWTVAR